eukprot:scaffold354_cov116-Isochrysis_galbana.AAC.14
MGGRARYGWGALEGDRAGGCNAVRPQPTALHLGAPVRYIVRAAQLRVRSLRPADRGISRITHAGCSPCWFSRRRVATAPKADSTAETWSAADGAGVGRRHRPGLLGRPRTPLPHPPALVPQKQEHAEGDKDVKGGRGADDGEHHYRSRGSTVPSTTAGGTSDDAEIERLGGSIVHTHTALRGGEGLMQPVELGGAHRPARLEQSPVHALGARGSCQRARPEIIPGGLASEGGGGEGGVSQGQAWWRAIWKRAECNLRGRARRGWRAPASQRSAQAGAKVDGRGRGGEPRRVPHAGLTGGSRREIFPEGAELLVARILFREIIQHRHHSHVLRSAGQTALPVVLLVGQLVDIVRLQRCVLPVDGVLRRRMIVDLKPVEALAA